jgi:hypothetical protein
MSLGTKAKLFWLLLILSPALLFDLDVADELKMLIASTSIPALTLYFSYHPRLFVGVFVPRDELRHVLRTRILHDHSQRRAMRLIAVLQFGVVAIISLIALWR